MAMDKTTSSSSSSSSSSLLVLKDAVDVLLRDTGESNEAQQSLPLDFISGNIIEMMIPGEDSVPMVMTLAVKYLSDSPIALARLVVCTLPLPLVQVHNNSLTTIWYSVTSYCVALSNVYKLKIHHLFLYFFQDQTKNYIFTFNLKACSISLPISFTWFHSLLLHVQFVLFLKQNIFNLLLMIIYFFLKEKKRKSGRKY